MNLMWHADQILSQLCVMYAMQTRRTCVCPYIAPDDLQVFAATSSKLLEPARYQ